MNSLGELISNVRKERGYTQDQLASLMNVSRQTVSHWENGRILPDIERMKDTKKRKAAVKAAGKLDIPEEVKKFYWLHEQYGGYAEVARRTGRSASTIGKYIRMAGMTKAHRHAVEQMIGRK